MCAGDRLPKKQMRRLQLAPKQHSCVLNRLGCSQLSNTECASGQLTPCAHVPVCVSTPGKARQGSNVYLATSATAVAAHQRRWYAWHAIHKLQESGAVAAISTLFVHSAFESFPAHACAHGEGQPRHMAQSWVSAVCVSNACKFSTMR